MLGIDLFLKAVLLVCQLCGKTQSLLKMLNCLSKQLFRLLTFGLHRLFKITAAQPILGIVLLLNLAIFIFNSI